MIRLVLLFLLIFRPVYASIPDDIIEHYDLKMYSPMNQGLKDLIFEVTVEGLTEKLKERLKIDSLGPVSFRVYWMFPGQYRIEVGGIPKSFLDLQKELKALIVGQLDFVIPVKLTSKLRGYEISFKDKDSDPVKIRAVEPTKRRVITEMELQFLKSGKLKGIHARSPRGETLTEFDLNPKSWSNNKWTLDKSIVEMRTNQGRIITETNVSYRSVAGLGFPEKLDITTRQKALIVEKKKLIEKEFAKQNSTMIFSNYVVNSGKAKEFITQGK